MKRINSLKQIIILILITFSGSSFAFNVGGARDECRPPKFRSFSPPERVGKGPIPEVEPESEISFTVSATADPESIVVIAKKIALEATIINKNSFIQVKAKLPAELSGKFARIDIRAEDQRGDCKSEDGWLIKIKKAADIGSEKVVEKVDDNTVEKKIEPVSVETLIESVKD